MDDRIQYKMFNLEVAPPENAWDNIESVLNNQQAVSLIQRFNELEVIPPVTAWSAIAAELDGRPVRPSPVIQFNFRRLAAAAAIIGVISVATWLMIQDNKSDSVPSAAAALVPPVTPPARAFKPANPNASPAAKVEQISAVAPTIHLRPSTATAGVISVDQSIRTIEPIDPIRSRSYNQIAVNAPLIRGTDGKPTIDYQLLSAGDKKYITITSPNGEQTKISSKFLPVLTYLNDQGSKAAEAIEWVAKFQRWKKRLLEDPDYVPAAGNFLDLPELTDVFQEQ